MWASSFFAKLANNFVPRNHPSNGFVSNISGKMTVVEPAMQQIIPSIICVMLVSPIIRIVKIAPLNSTTGMIETM